MRLKVNLDFKQPNQFGNTVLFNASWTSDYITNFLIHEFNLSCESINLYFANPSFIFKNTVSGLLKNGCNPFARVRKFSMRQRLCQNFILFRTLPLVEPYIKFIEPRLNYMTEWLDQFYEMLITELNRIPKRPIHEKPERFDNVFSACPYLNARANFAAIEADEGSR